MRRYGPRVLKHYLTLLLEQSDLKTDSDTWSEINELCNDIDEQFDKLEEKVSDQNERIDYLEQRISGLSGLIGQQSINLKQVIKKVYGVQDDVQDQD